MHLLPERLLKIPHVNRVLYHAQNDLPHLDRDGRLIRLEKNRGVSLSIQVFKSVRQIAEAASAGGFQCDASAVSGEEGDKEIGVE